MLPQLFRNCPGAAKWRLTCLAAAVFSFGLAHATALAQTTDPAPADDAQRTEETHGAWTLRCVTVGEPAAQRCEMVQLVSDPQSGREVLLMAIGYPNGQDPAVAWVVLPLGVLLPPGIGLKIDQGETKGLPYRACDTRGCATPWPLTEQEIAALKAGTELVVIFRDIEGKAIGVPVSLSGFTAAFDKLR